MIENSIINIKHKNTRKAEERKYNCMYFHWMCFIGVNRGICVSRFLQLPIPEATHDTRFFQGYIRKAWYETVIGDCRSHEN